MDKEKNSRGGRHGNGVHFFILFLLILIFCLIVGAAMFLSIQNDKVIAMGKAGFIRNAVWRIVLGGLALGGVFFCLRGLWKKEKNWKGILGRITGSAACLLTACFLVRPVILDIPYLDSPAITYLERLEFDEDHTGDGPVRYYLRGTGIDGTPHSFSLNKEEYEEGKNLWTEDAEFYAKVTYLPHTDVVLLLSYLPDLDEQAEELFPHSADLPNDWKSFAIQINDTVYTLPAPLTDFLENGWTIDEQDAELRLPGADEPYERYSRQGVRLVNTQKQSIEVTVYNTAGQTIDIAQGIVGDVYVIYGNYEFAGTDLRLPGGLMLGWSARESVLEKYGKPAESFEEYSLTYQDSAAAYWKLFFDEAGRLNEVMAHNQAYGREN